MNDPNETLRYHVTGAIERGEAEPIYEMSPAAVHLEEMRDLAARIEKLNEADTRERIGGDAADHGIAELGIQLAELVRHYNPEGQ